MRKKYTIHKKRKYTKKNKIKKSKNKIKYTKKKYKKKIKTKRKQRGGMENEEFYPYEEIDDPDHLREIIRDKEAELEEQYNQLQQAAVLGQGLVVENEALKAQLNEEGIDSDNLSVALEEADYRKQEIEGERTTLDEDITKRQKELEELKQGLERERISEKEELELLKQQLNMEKTELQERLDREISELSDRLNTKQAELDKLNEEKGNLQGEYKKLSVSLGNEKRLCKTKFEKEKKESNRRISEIEDKLRKEELEKAGVQEKLNLKQRELTMKSSEYESNLNECHSKLERFEVGDTGSSLADELGLSNQLADNPSNEEMRNLKNENNRLKSEIKRLLDEGRQTRALIDELVNI
jgi:chromosome segregation ATPase